MAHLLFGAGLIACGNGCLDIHSEIFTQAGRIDAPFGSQTNCAISLQFVYHGVKRDGGFQVFDRHGTWLFCVYVIRKRVGREN